MLHILASVFCYDIWFYVSHIILHHRYFYHIHKQHHTKLQPTFLDTYEGHWFEGPFQSVGMFAPFAVWHYSTLEFAIILLLLNARGMLRHDVRGIPIVGDHHLIHHQHPSYNYGEPWLDALFGTIRPKAAIASARPSAAAQSAFFAFSSRGPSPIPR